MSENHVGQVMTHAVRSSGSSSKKENVKKGKIEEVHFFSHFWCRGSKMIVYLKYVEVELICQPIRSPEITRKQDGYYWGGHWPWTGFTKRKSRMWGRFDWYIPTLRHGHRGQATLCREVFLWYWLHCIRCTLACYQYSLDNMPQSKVGCVFPMVISSDFNMG